MKCANCDRPAIYKYDPRPLTPTYYCDKHLPLFLEPSAKMGLLETTPAFDEVRRSALEKLSPASVPDAVEEEVQPVEALVEAEEPPVERPKRKRRTAKKAAPLEETAPEGAEQ